MPSSLRRPVSARPAPMRTGSWISSVRRHQPSAAVKTTSRNELDPKSQTAMRRSAAMRPAE